MARRLIDGDPREEQRRQSRILDRLDRIATPQIAGEIARASYEMLRRFEARESNIAAGLPEHQRRMGEIMNGIATAAVIAFARRIPDQARHIEGLETKEFARTVARMAAAYVAMEAFRRRITFISETTRDSIIDRIDAGLTDGLGIAEIARAINTVIPGETRSRAAMIARTETHGAANYGADAAARATGLDLRKEWVSADDERTRESHAEANGQIVGMNDAFDVGGEALMFPGDPEGSPENTINCRCSVAHIVVD
jgi:uncharacterized protein with gpF-like domain